jgi:hypothetical protein
LTPISRWKDNTPLVRASGANLYVGTSILNRVESRRLLGEDRWEKVSWRGSMGEGLPEKAEGRRSPDEGRQEKVSK